MSVLLGFVPQPEEMSVVIKKHSDFTFINDTVIVMPFEVQVPGVYYMAFRACSRADSYAILLRSIEIDEYDPNSVSLPTVRSLVRGGMGCIEVTAQEPTAVRIYNLLGEEVGNFIAHTGTRHEIESGIYIVHAGKTIQKIIVL
jgi:Zn-dependent alcohol dehydrogenase